MKTVLKGWVALGFLLGCHGAGGAVSSSPTTPSAGGSAGLLPACGTPSSELGRLDSYRGLAVPGTYWVDMAKGEHGEWWPIEHVSMHFHQAVRMELTNLDEVGALASHEDDTVRFTLAFSRKHQRAVPGRPNVRVTFVARVVTLCVPDAPVR